MKRIKSSQSNISFCGGIAIPDFSKPIIRDGMHICGDGGKTIISTLDNHLNYIEYLQEIAKSKISVSMRGHGYCGNPNRHFEIPSFNTLMLCEASNSYYEYPFDDGKTCIFFDPNKKDDVYEKAMFWLKDENENKRRKIAKAGNDLLKEHHTCKKRADRLLEIVKIEGLM